MSMDRSRHAGTTCTYPGCGRPVWRDPNGTYSSYCGRKHRDAMAYILPPREQLCQNCNARPVYIENGRRHPFCGIRCAKSFRSNGGPESATPPSSQSGVHCQFPGCNLAAHRGLDGQVGQFCSDRHRRLAVKNKIAEACLFCTDMPKAIVNGKTQDFCSRRCGEDATEAAPIILDVPSHHEAYRSVTNQFQSKWEHNNDVPTVRKIWKVYATRELKSSFESYQLAIERKTNMPKGNTCRRWHGTIRDCRLGDEERNRDLCNSLSCSLCSIIKSSFMLVKAGEHTNFGRFGKGIYTSATSSKANDYVESDNSPYRAMLLNSVVMGKAIKLTRNSEGLIKPPKGFDSVIGEPGDDLNYDESVVYSNEAIRPLYLVIYGD